MKQYILIKKSDDVFGGFHPNGIDQGYSIVGNYNNLPTVGERFTLTNRFNGRYLHTSIVTEIISDELFKTENSTYELLEYIE